MAPTRGFIRGRVLAAVVLWAAGLVLGFVLSGGCGPLVPLGGTADGGAAGDADGGRVCGEPPVSSCAGCDDGTGCDDGSPTCAAGGCLCHAGACVAGCLIAGVFHADGEADPADPCETCDAAARTSGWTPVANGTACADDGNACTVDACAAGACTHPPLAAGTACGASGSCDGHGTCSARCDVGGTVVADGAPNPANPCQRCDTRRSTTAWSPRPTGSRCGAAGRICADGGQCVTGCLILGTGFADGAANPANPCQQCQAAISTTTWRSVADGTGCGPDVCGGFGACTYGTVCDATGSQARTCEPRICHAGACVTGDPRQVTRACTRANRDGTACDDGQACTADDVCTAGVCGGTAYTCKSDACRHADGCDGTGGCLWRNKRDGTKCKPASCDHGACEAGECVACAAKDARGSCCTSSIPECHRPVDGVCL